MAYFCQVGHKTLAWYLSNNTHRLLWLVAWHSGRTSVFGRRTFPVPCL